jgi:hypothetical protein
MHEAPFVLLAVLLGTAFGWRFLGAGAVLWFALIVRLKADQKWPPGLEPKWYRTTIDAALSAIFLSILGGVTLGGIGVIFGFAVGIVWATSSIPLSVKNPKKGAASAAGIQEPERLHLTLQNSPATTKALTITGLASPVLLLLACVLLLATHHN